MVHWTVVPTALRLGSRYKPFRDGARKRPHEPKVQRPSGQLSWSRDRTSFTAWRPQWAGQICSEHLISLPELSMEHSNYQSNVTCPAEEPAGTIKGVLRPCLRQNSFSELRQSHFCPPTNKLSDLR